MSSSGIGWDVSSLMSSIHYFLCRPRGRSSYKVPGKMVLETVVVCDMPEPCEYLSPDSCPRRFLWDLEKVDLALRPVVGLLLQVGNAEKFPLLREVCSRWSKNPNRRRLETSRSTVDHKKSTLGLKKQTLV